MYTEVVPQLYLQQGTSANLHRLMAAQAQSRRDSSLGGKDDYRMAIPGVDVDAPGRHAVGEQPENIR